MTKDDEPKIIVDDDWKEQVAKEKEAAAAQSSGTTESDQTPSDETSSDVAPSDEMPAGQTMPPASFETLVSMMFTQGMAMLGMVPNPETGEATVNKPFAKHTIDTLEVLTEKTKGNLTDDESKMLGEALHALRMAYVGSK
jgi:hypothetical protein